MGYSSKDIISLGFPLNVQKRLDMYAGAQAKNDKTPGQRNCLVREILDNAVGEAMGGYANTVTVTFCKDGFIEVLDNGRGLPIDKDDKGVNGIIKTVGMLHSGGSFSSNAKYASPSLNGVGSAISNSCSARFDAIVFRRNRRYCLSFKNGYPGHFDKNDDSEKAEFTESKNIKSVAYEHERGTLIRFKFNDKFFSKVDNLIIDDIIDRMRYTVYLVPGLTIVVHDKTRKKEEGGGTYKFVNVGGISGMVDFISSGDSVITSKDNEYTKKGIYSITGKGRYKQRIIDVASGTAKETVRNSVIDIEVGLKFNEEDKGEIRSFANTICTYQGGIHENALKEALVDTFGKYASKNTKGRAKVEEDDVLANITAVININLMEPHFSSQAKVRLSGKDEEDAIKAALVREFNKFIRDELTEEQMAAVSKRIVNNSKIRAAAEVAKATKKKSLIKRSPSNLPSKLKECKKVGDDLAELYICEGLSAAGSILAARDAEYQAVLPLRGKVLNVMKLDLTNKNQRKRFENNAEINDMIKALGAGILEHFDLEKIRYGRCILASDSDVDGGHINTLLVGIFYKLFKPMIEDGRLFQCLSPLFEITYKVKGQETTEYAVDEVERLEILKRLKSKGIKKYEISRCKGLGEINADLFENYVLNPKNRRVIQITIEDAEHAADMLSMTIGDGDAQGRRDWMLDNTQVIDNLGLYE